MGFLSRFACAVLAALALLATASAGVNTPQSGWYSGNPLLGPNTLHDLACAGPTCYASGDFGTLLKSTDSGETWSGIVTGLTLNLARVRLAGGSVDHVVTGGGCALRRSDDGGSTFFRLPFTARDTGCADGVVSFSFPTENTGYLLLGNGRVLATADGGHTFSRRTSVPGTANDILCTAERTCIAVGPVGLIERTADGGVSWTQVGNANSGLVAITQADPLTLYAVGIYRTVMKSTDGGDSWIRKTALNPQTNLKNIGCGDALHCLVANEAGNELLRTTDGGDNWSSITPSSDATFAVTFSRANRALAAGALGSAEVSNDAGATWAAVGSRIAGTFTKLAAVSGEEAYAGGEGGVLARTTDAGQTWKNVSPPTEASIVGLAGSRPDRVYVLAGDGSLQRSDNGGSSYRLLNPGTVRSKALLVPGLDKLLLIGPSQILRSINGGEAFQPVGGRLVRWALPVSGDLAGTAVFAYGQRRVIASTDGGIHWVKVATPRPRAIFDLDFVSRRVGFLLDDVSNVWKTVDGGRHWRELQGVGTASGYQLTFADARNGYVLSFAAVSGRQLTVVLRTSDGGLSWHPQIVSPLHIDALASGGGTDYLLAGARDLYATQVRGDIGRSEKLTISARPRSRARAGSVVVSGRLNPADGGEEIVISRFAGGNWARRVVVAAANGTFTSRWRVTRKSVFVAQVLGDADHVGAGTPPLTVRVG